MAEKNKPGRTKRKSNRIKGYSKAKKAINRLKKFRF